MKAKKSFPLVVEKASPSTSVNPLVVIAPALALLVYWITKMQLFVGGANA